MKVEIIPVAAGFMRDAANIAALWAADARFGAGAVDELNISV